MRIVVVLPAPLGPRNPNTSPGPTLNDRALTAFSDPYLLVNFLASIILMSLEIDKSCKVTAAVSKPKHFGSSGYRLYWVMNLKSRSIKR
jgi:hypothetical protein